MYLSWLARPDLQERFDLATQTGRSDFAQWCYRGAYETRGLAARVKQRLDRAVSMLDQRPRRPGCNLVGYSRGVLGMGEHVRMTAHSMSAVGVPFDVVDFSLGLGKARRSPELVDRTSRRASRQCTIMHVNADQMVRAYWHFGPQFFKSRYIVGYWAWELERFPEEWHPVLGLVDELWAPSEFIQSALLPLTSKPVVHMPLCVELPPFPALARPAFGLSEAEFVFVFAFDCHSWLARKNPAAVVRAFKAAFPDHEPVRLVLKAMHGAEHDLLWRNLVATIGDDARIALINEVWPRERLLALVASSDVYISLHRSEGFGRGPAEAMLLGKPVIATGYSGTQDFCRNSNCLLVRSDRIGVKPGEYPHGQNQSWAEPDDIEAASHMRRLFEDRNLGARLGAAGRKTISEEFCAESIGRRYRARLEELGLLNEQELK